MHISPRWYFQKVARYYPKFMSNFNGVSLYFVINKVKFMETSNLWFAYRQLSPSPRHIYTKGNVVHEMYLGEPISVVS